MSDSGEQNYGERVRGGALGGGYVVPVSCFQTRRPRTGRRAILAPKSEAGRMGRRVKRAFVDSAFSREEAAGRFIWLRTRVDGFFRYKGGLKMAAASPRCWGRGAVSHFAVALLRSLAAAILGWRAGRAARGTKWRRGRAPSRAAFAPHKATYGLGKKGPLGSLTGL